MDPACDESLSRQMASLSATVRRTHLLDIHTHRICREALHLRSHVLVQLALKVESERPVSNCGRSGCGLAARTGSERLSGWMEVTHRVQAERLGGYPQTSFVAHRGGLRRHLQRASG